MVFHELTHGTINTMDFAYFIKTKPAFAVIKALQQHLSPRDYIEILKSKAADGVVYSEDGGGMTGFRKDKKYPMYDSVRTERRTGKQISDDLIGSTLDIRRGNADSYALFATEEDGTAFQNTF